eukprot:Gb_21769 [translate_table: standard]
MPALNLEETSKNSEQRTPSTSSG